MPRERVRTIFLKGQSAGKPYFPASFSFSDPPRLFLASRDEPHELRRRRAFLRWLMSRVASRVTLRRRFFATISSGPSAQRTRAEAHSKGWTRQGPRRQWVQQRPRRPYPQAGKVPFPFSLDPTVAPHFSGVPLLFLACEKVRFLEHQCPGLTDLHAGRHLFSCTEITLAHASLY